MTPVIKYAIVDDHKLFRSGVKAVLLDDSQLECVFEAGDGQELLDKLKTHSVDVILLDYQMPHLNGLEALTTIRKQNSKVKVLMLSMHHEEQRILELMKAGANGYLLKTAEAREIHDAITSVAKAEYYFNDVVSVALLRKIIEQESSSSRKQATEIKLTPRELDVLLLICQEMTAAEIADELKLSTRTVEGLRSTLMEKIQVKNVAGLVMYAFRSGLVK
ncbi:MAG: response regulator [Flavobacteriales bacterium]|jgi:DNA-binding NarL/FixJ family response regulator